MDVVLKGAKDLWSAPMQILYDPQQLQVVPPSPAGICLTAMARLQRWFSVWTRRPDVLIFRSPGRCLRLESPAMGWFLHACISEQGFGKLEAAR